MLLDNAQSTDDAIIIEDSNIIPASNNLIPTNTAIQSKNRYVTAMQVIKPRNLNRVIGKCVEEASIAGEEFIYSWKQGGSIVEGLTIGAALSIVRNFGNCMIDVDIEEKDKAYIFTAYFCDLETGFNLSRSFRQNKASPKNKYGKDIYEGDRGIDIIFQIGQSKAIRNVVLNAIPRWLASKVLEEAKNNAMATINNMGEVKARELISRKIDNLKIDLSRVEGIYGKAKSWDKVKLVQLSSALKSIENGYEDEDVLFPPISATSQMSSVKSQTLTSKSEILTQAEKDELLTMDTQTISPKIMDSAINGCSSDESSSSCDSDQTTQPANNRVRQIRVNQEILRVVDGDFKRGADELERIFGRKFKFNASLASQLSSSEIESIDGKFANLLTSTQQIAA